MCNLIFTLHQHCSHEQYQNTFPCHMVRGCEPYDTMVLDEAVFLFDTKKNPKLYPDSPCRKRKLKRPAQSLCDVCKKKQLKLQENSNTTKGKARDIISLTNSVSTPSTKDSPGAPFSSESPSSPDADLESAQNTTIVSLLRLSRLQPGFKDSPGSMSRNYSSFNLSPLSDQEKQRLSEL